MKNSILILLSLFILYSCQENNEKKVNPVNQYTIEQFLENENSFANGFSPDKKNILLTSNRSGVYNIYNILSNGEQLIPITKSDSASVFGISFFPKDDRILFRMDGNGDEIFKIFMKDSSGIKNLTPLKNVRALFRGWSKDGKSFFYGSNERNAKFMDHYEMDIETFESTLIYQNNDGMSYGGMSEDKKYILLTKSINTNDSDLFLLNNQTKDILKINENLSSNSPQDFAPDGNSFYYTTDDNSEFSYLMSYNLKDGSKSKVLEKKWDITNFYFTRNGKYKILFTNEDAKSVMEVKEVSTGNLVSFPEISNQNITGARFSRDETMAILTISSSNMPTNSYSFDLESNQYQQLTDVLNKEINSNDLVRAEVIRYKSFDGLEIPAIYYTPQQASTSNKVPAIVWVHGGPGGQSNQRFNSTIQYLVNHGYAILAVNNRGSSG